MSKEPTESSGDSSSSADAGNRKRTRRRIPPLWLWLFVAVCLGGFAWFMRPERPDRLIGNSVSMGLGMLAFLVLAGWYVLRSGFSRRARWTPVFCLLILAAGFTALFRFEFLTGFGVPVFALRWSPQRVALVDVPSSSGEATSIQVDLSITSDTDFPGFLGPGQRLAVENVTLTRDWDAHPPKLVWRQPIGEGWSAFSVVNGFAVTMEQRGDTELVSCYDIDMGELLWWHGSEVRHADVMGGVGPRSTPTIHEGRVYAVGATGLFYCLDGASGEVIWEKDLVREFGSTPEKDIAAVAWGRAGSPLIVDQMVIVPAGGPSDENCVSLVAYDRIDGSEIWRGGERQIAYASPSLATLAGTRQILIVNQNFVTGHDLETGQRLWEHDWPGVSNGNANTSQAIGVLGDSVFVSKGYSEGAVLLRIAPQSDGTWTAEERWKNQTMKTRFTNVTIREGFVYGLDDGILECIELETGKRRWKRGRYGNGQLLQFGELLLVIGEFGELVLVEANPDRHVELGQFQAIEGKTWNNLCFSAPYLLVRNAEEAACYELTLAGE